MESLKSLDRARLVAYVGTFSKTLFPDLRIGYVVPPTSLAEPLHAAKQICDWHSGLLMQNALAAFMLDGDYAKHLRRMHKTYAARRALLIERLSGELAPWFEPLPAMASIHLVARLLGTLDESRVVAAAQAVSVGVYGIAGFYADRPRERGLLLGYGGTDLDAIERGTAWFAALMPRCRADKRVSVAY